MRGGSTIPEQIQLILRSVVYQYFCFLSLVWEVAREEWCLQTFLKMWLT